MGGAFDRRGWGLVSRGEAGVSMAGVDEVSRVTGCTECAEGVTGASS